MSTSDRPNATKSSPDFLSAALAYARLGYSVFPCMPGEKRPAIRNGVKGATDDPGQIRKWWTRQPECNVGIATAGLLVVDIDDPDSPWLTMERELDLSRCPISRTPRGGTHYWMKEPAGAELRNTAGKLAPKIDTRSTGGYVLAPPSIVNGNPYTWESGEGSPASQLSEPSDWLLELLTAGNPEKATPTKTNTAVTADGDIPDGSRNDSLTSLAGSMRRKGFSEAAITNALLVHNREHCKPPKPESEVRTIAKSVSRYKPVDDRVSIISLEGRTDVANARRFVMKHGDKARYCHPWRRWVVWCGTHWRIDNDGSPTRLAKSIVDDLWVEARKVDSSKALRYAAESATEFRVRAMQSLAQSELPITPDELDTDLYLLNVPNGTLDLTTGQLREHCREDFIAKLCPTEFHPEAEAPTWERFLWDIFMGDEALIEFCQLWFGYNLTGDTREQVMAILWGDGSNGKSTLIGILQTVLGDDYSMQADSSLLLSKRNDSHPTNIADLFRMRLVVCMEMAARRTLDEALVRQLTGGDRIRARKMRQDFWEFAATHKLSLATNHKPEIHGTDYAIWRRLRLIPFTRRFDEANKDPTMPQRLAAERDGILAWLVRGCLAWQERGLTAPEAVLRATDAYQVEENPIGRFINEQCERRRDAKVRFSELYAAYQEWSDDESEMTQTKKVVGVWLRQNGFEEKQSGGRWYLGLSLKPDRSTSELLDVDRSTS